MDIINQMQPFVVSLLQNKLPSHFIYHNHWHTVYVLEKAIEIAKHENCTENELRLIAAAALWHDTGCIISFHGHEEISCNYAKHYLPSFDFSNEDIEMICTIIMATKIPQTPINKLGEILADADLEYLGTDDVWLKADKLFQEVQLLNTSLTEEEWHQLQISFLQNHEYFTSYCKKVKEPQKQVYLNTLLNKK